MKKKYDFSRGKRGAVLSTAGKTRTTIYLDNATLERFKAESQRTGKGCQTLVNEALAKSVGLPERPVRRQQWCGISRALADSRPTLTCNAI
jgi:hypothetical protein